ncbi:hypothetical protein NL108_007282 [Boleophthalmus pectinirostris]|nr:hypothetical protein NL108_007282 [Boleophthalmus pectinirostris]
MQQKNYNTIIKIKSNPPIPLFHPYIQPFKHKHKNKNIKVIIKIKVQRLQHWGDVLSLPGPCQQSCFFGVLWLFVAFVFVAAFAFVVTLSASVEVTCCLCMILYCNIKLLVCISAEQV